MGWTYGERADLINIVADVLTKFRDSALAAESYGEYWLVRTRRVFPCSRRETVSPHASNFPLEWTRSRNMIFFCKCVQNKSRGTRRRIAFYEEKPALRIFFFSVLAQVARNLRSSLKFTHTHTSMRYLDASRSRQLRKATSNICVGECEKLTWRDWLTREYIDV